MRVTNLSVHLAVSLGEPLPHQLADGTGAPPLATGPCGSRPFNAKPCGFAFTSGISGRFQPLFRTKGQLALALLALPPLSKTNIATGLGPFDLHASSTLPAFDLSQNQTLRRIEISHFRSGSFPCRFRPGFEPAIALEFRVCIRNFPAQTYLTVGPRLPHPAQAENPAGGAWGAEPEKAVPFSKSGAASRALVADPLDP